MSVLRDAALLTPAQRERASLRFCREMKRIADPPDLPWFNFEPCADHKPDPHPLCRSCGIIPRNHQWVGSLRMYLGISGLLSDTVGSGKTATAIMMLAMYKQMGHLSYDRRAVVVCQPNAMSDPWAKDLARLVPGIDVIIADGTPKKRREAWAGDWEVAVVSSRTFAPAEASAEALGRAAEAGRAAAIKAGASVREQAKAAGEAEAEARRKNSRPGDVGMLLARGDVDILICDDVDELRSPDTRTFRAVTRFARTCSRVHMLHATPLQKKLMELWAYLVAVGGNAPNRLGDEERCRQRYVVQTRKSITIPDPSDKTGRKVSRRVIWVDNGMKKNDELVAEFRARIAPLVLRRTAADLDDVTLPEVQVNQVWLDLSAPQRRRYDELRDGVLRRLRGSAEEVSYSAAVAAFNYGQQICAGLASLDEGPGADISVKLDWVMDALTGDLSDEKAICFVHNQGNVRALSQRLRAAGIGHVLLWGGMTDQKRRAERMRRFREDDRARVLVGSLTIKKSLNLQVARHMIGVDTILNPAGMEQLIGRYRRQGSPFPMVFFHHLLARMTQEDAYPALLRREQETADLVWNETSDIRWVLTPRQLLRMVAEGRVGAR